MCLHSCSKCMFVSAVAAHVCTPKAAMRCKSCSIWHQGCQTHQGAYCRCVQGSYGPVHVCKHADWGQLRCNYIFIISSTPNADHLRDCHKQCQRVPVEVVHMCRCASMPRLRPRCLLYPSGSPAAMTRCIAPSAPLCPRQRPCTSS